MKPQTRIAMIARQAPAAPPAGFAVVFFDKAARKLKIRKADGSIVDLEAAT